MEIRRFGPGQRRAGGPPGTRGVEGQVILHDERAVISELAFGRYAMITPHANPTNTALFIVISGGGYVQVGDERARVNHGEAVLWPPGELHGAYTDGSEMRAIVVELAPLGQGLLIEGAATEADAHSAEAGDSESAEPRPGVPHATRAQGTLGERTVSREEYDSSEGEPW
jgi:quercetin dioxygenase-like cupin family protein